MKSTGNGFIGNIRHIEVDYDKKNYCGHPRQCGIANFGGGKLVALYWRAPCNYEEQSDISHSFYDGYLRRADIVLRRSLDHGDTWPADNDVIVWSNAWSLVRRRDFLSQDPARQDILDMSGPEAMFFFGRTSMFRWDPEATTHSEYLPVFQIRSVDKGHTWKDVPVVLDPSPSIAGILKDNHPPVTVPDGARVGAMTAPHDVAAISGLL